MPRLSLLTLMSLLLCLSPAGHSADAPAVRVIIAHDPLAHAPKTPKNQEKVYRSHSNGITRFSDRIPLAGRYDVLLFDCYACDPASTINWYQTPLFRRNYQTEIAKAAKHYQLEPALIRAVIHAESAFDASAKSRSGAMGLMQLMPQTAQALGVKNAFSVSENIDAGSRYLSQMLQRFKGNISLACAAYNAGPSNVARHNGIPPFAETKAYVERVQILLQRYRAS
ncbi:lytic transglycosylase domain-containing protein [Shewanella sp. YIC-542]|uniref:lytic transglycosylase domain-containing protein n=1 Tax=Shewanella mytili TaxID=3377111 RepID=UPI00398EA2CD